MSIYRRKSGRYQVLIDLDADATGLRKRKAIGTYRTAKEAQAAERKALEARHRGAPLQSLHLTLADVAERFFDETRPPVLTPNTWVRYCELWRVHIAPELGAIQLAKLRVNHVLALYARLKRASNRRGGTLSGRSVLHIHRMVYRICSWAEQRELVETNVLRRVPAPTPNESPARALDPDEAATILHHAKGSRWYEFFVLAIATGARRGELAALRWEAVDLERCSLTIHRSMGTDRRGGYYLKAPKSGRRRCVPLAPAAIDALRAVRVRQAKEKLAAGEAYRDEGWVFADPIGNAPRLDAPTKAFADLVRELGFTGASLHSCRHFLATQALVNGSDIRSVAAVLGHAKASTTLNAYSHVVTGAQERVVAVVRDVLSVAQARLREEAN